MPTPLFENRTLYAPAHFGNTHEVMGVREMRSVISEAKFWGYTHYGDWFDTIDCSDPFADPGHHNLGHAMWMRKKQNYRSACELGLKCAMTITPNHVFLDQCEPDLLATKGDRIFGQLICPSIPRAREIILGNYENWFDDLAKAGVALSALCPLPYDYGGCSCEDCSPYIITFAELMRDIHAIAEEHHPGVEMHPIGWWWGEEEHRLHAEWSDRETPGLVKSISLHIPYGETSVGDVLLPRGCERRAFVHIGYADKAQPRDVYGHLGAVIAWERIEQTVRTLKAQNCTGVMAYDEGSFDDVNRAILAGLGSGQHATADDVIRAYVERYFGPETVEAWVSWLKAWGTPFEADAAALLAEYESLSAGREPSWRLRQWGLKAELLAIHVEIGDGDEWPDERLAEVERFQAAEERLQREVWGLGTMRHIFARQFNPLPWYGSWAKHEAEEAVTRRDGE